MSHIIILVIKSKIKEEEIGEGRWARRNLSTTRNQFVLISEATVSVAAVCRDVALEEIYNEREGE